MGTREKKTKGVEVGKGVSIGPGLPWALIAGPCVVEDPLTMDQIASELGDICAKYGRPLIFKASYEKDNRTHAGSYRGPGLDAGLEALMVVGERFGLPTTTDVHRVEDVAVAAKAVELLQIPALLCRQTSLLEAAGASGRAVNIKKGQFMAPAAMAGAVEKVRGAGGEGVLLTERGSMFGYERLVCDTTAVPAMQALGCPVVGDAGHASNTREEITALARALVGVGVDALFVEVHPEPEKARCDGGRSLSLTELSTLLGQLAELRS
ncbi:MAG: 3-deoxy-8-phosphooctulonate synthase [Deltaproteobacteria bacterium]|nr:3-deoxy-8-phosphooctulonate synthase [Deltaproteobacteria bacterium]